MIEESPFSGTLFLCVLVLLQSNLTKMGRK